MISISQTQTTKKFVLSPRPGFKRAVKEIECELVYGHRCKYCGNVIQALFKTPRSINLWPFEETKVISQGEKNMGELLKIFPEDNTKHGLSLYNSTFSPAGGGSQRIVLKNHLIRLLALQERQPTGEGLWEPSHDCKVCPYTGFFSLREEVMIRDMCLFSQWTESDLTRYNIPSTAKEIFPQDSEDFIVVPSIGDAPPIVLTTRPNILYGYQRKLTTKMTPFIKNPSLK